MGSDRRAFIRHGVRWEAEIQSEGGAVLPMEIRDFCEGGAFLLANSRRAATDLKHTVRADDTITLRARNPFGDDQLEVPARAARVSPSGLGLSFHAPAPALVTGLMAVSAGQVTRAAPEQTTGDASALQASLTAIHEHLAPALDGFVTQAESRLLEATREASGTAAGQGVPLENLRVLQTRAAALRDVLLDELDTAWLDCGQFRVPGDQDQNAGTSGLSLVSDHDFEEWLARSEVISRAETRNRARLHRLHRRLAQVTGATIDNEGNPVSPAALCHFLERRLEALELDLASRRVLYEVFGEAVMRRIGDLYDRLNEQLRERGVLPDLEDEGYTITNLRSHHLPRQRPGVDGGGDASRRGAASAAALDLLSERTRALFDRRGNNTEPGRNGAGRAASTETDRDSAPERGLRSQARATAATGEQLDAGTATNVDFLEHWLTGIHHPGGGDERLQPWLRRLTPAALRAELRDGDLPARRQHGLNRLIDELDRVAGIAAALDSDQAEALDEPVNAAIDRICNAPDDETVVTQALGELDTLVACHEEAAGTAFERLRERYTGNERLEEARRAVDEQLATTLGRNRIPAPLRDLLEQGWHQHLVLTHLREGADSQAWTRGVRTVDLLLRALGGVDGQRHGVRRPERLLDYIRYQLERTGAGDAAERTGALADWLTGVRRDELPTQVPPPPPTTRPTPEPDRPQQWLGRARLLAPGDAVVIPGADGHDTLGRLVWTDTHRTRFVFADALGRKVADFGLAELADAFADGRARAERSLALPATQRRWQEILEELTRDVERRTAEDAATGLLDKRGFRRRLRGVLESDEGTHTATVCRFQLSLNDTTTDDPPRALAEQLRDAVPDDAVLARVETNTLDCLLPGWQGDASAAFAEAQCRLMRSRQTGAEGSSAPVTVTAGVVPIHAAGTELATVLAELEAACARARERGDGCELATANAPSRADDREPLARLDERIAAGGLALVRRHVEALTPEQQPLVLVRARRYTDGPEGSDGVDPSLAERHGRLPAVDRAVIQGALAWCRANAGEIAEWGTVLVPVTGQTLADSTFPAWLDEQLHAAALPAGTLTLALAEPRVRARLADAARLLRVLQRYGAGLALRAFAGEQPARETLDHLAVSHLMLDSQLVRVISDNAPERELVSALQARVTPMGITTIATGVDSSALLARLRGLGVNAALGEAVAPLETLPGSTG